MTTATDKLQAAAHLTRELLRRTPRAAQLNPRALGKIARALAQGSRGVALAYRINAALDENKVALVCGNYARTYGELDERLDRIRGGLYALGVRATDSVLLFMRNRAEFLELQGALARHGARAVSASYRSTPAELDYLLTHSNAKVVVFEQELAVVAEQIRNAHGDVQWVSIGQGPNTSWVDKEYETLAASARCLLPERPDDGALVIYTSGTTGKPKGAVRKFPRAAVLSALFAIAEFPIDRDERHLVVLPLYHSTAIGFAGFAMIMGATIYVEPDPDPETILAAISRHKITSVALVPTLIHRWLALPDEVRAKYDVSSLRAVISGGAPLSGSLAARFIHTVGPVLYNFYGATETGVNTVANSAELLASPGTIGHAIPGSDIRILDDAGARVADGVVGELYVKTPLLIDGYHRDQDATTRSMRDGYFSVGDLAHRDERGLLHIDGRKRDMIISGGVNVYPAEIEEVIHHHPAIAEAAVVGMPDDEWGERVCAFVVLREGASLDAATLTSHCKSQLAGPKVPRSIRFIDELPKNPTGKVLKRELRSRQ